MKTAKHIAVGIAALVAGVGAFSAAQAMPAQTPEQRVDVVHTPIAHTPENESVTVVADVRAGWSSRLELMVRKRGAAWHSITFERTADDEYVATIPGELIVAPSVEYFIRGESEAGTRLHFASPERPHRVYVARDEETELRERELARFDGNRAQISMHGELVDFGQRVIVNRADDSEHVVRDSYYRVDMGVTYRLMRYPLRAIRFGYSRLIGTTPTTSRGNGTCPESETPCAQSAGYRAGGWVETQWRLGELLRLDTRALIQATPTGFGLGGRGELRLGDLIGSHFAVGVESISEVGTASFLRLGWATVPRVQMAATIELSDYPSGHRATGVRLLYDCSYDVGNGLRLGLRAGYQARDEGIGGPALGSNVSFDF